ncbi:hypothetical protein [Paraburkholderia diazotrophica]|uniref:Uncharacterized protein n=1 Tax=Paraburkholderia diazotrophica TaxID=667676 RepID=A0A1H7DYE1_9BURK|nr:hypothetical protein [Paraburkholderia diazotrophica]SEK06746.1 hypothetical protein SAMN05192539_103728 [Paraburkholderia diazotrophica]
MIRSVIISVVCWVPSATRRNARNWIAGASLLLVSGALFAKAVAADHARLLPEREPTSILFYSYPQIPATAYAPQRRLHRYVVTSPLHMGTAAYGLYNRYSIAPDYGRLRFGQGLSKLDGLQAGEAPGSPVYGLTPDPQNGSSGSSTASDEWSFRANPLLNLNHSHERGATFSIRHDF